MESDQFIFEHEGQPALFKWANFSIKGSGAKNPYFPPNSPGYQRRAELR